MKQIDKKDLPKLILLVVLSVAVFAYAAVTIFKPAAPAAVAQPAAPPQSVVAATTGQTVSAQPVQDVIALAPGIAKDPFVPNGPASVEPDRTERMPALARMSVPAVPALPSASAARTAAAPPNWTGAEPVYATAPAPVEPPPAPDYVVTGIVRGATDIAILRGGEGGEERRFVRVGDSIGNGFTVAAIQINGVEIKSGERRLLLKLGDISRAK